MEIEASRSKDFTDRERNRIENDSIRVKRKTLQAVLEECQRALELLNQAEVSPDDGDNGDNGDGIGNRGDQPEEESSRKEEELSSSDRGDPEADELYDLIKSRVVCHDFLEKLETAQVPVPQHVTEDGSSWDVVSKDDLWCEKSTGQPEEDYVLVRQEDIVDGIANFMATYLSSLKQTKDLTPDQLQKALGRMFSVKKRKGKLRRAWDGSKVAYNVASWSATVIGIYQNPVILRVASKAFWASCQVISKLV
ncbi:PREDICTED: uncharacterized protein LOC104800042 isoform X2 [Tarenaya hassleriana]|uniref:uncharacterized protein LOC104800042 isoform X1 n=1 Tax=Tarenaya hassleriana TaxID=28532 RepID=UPI00053C7DA0|nr:PREDICTED: uncharacterized protein LOC104800042 isoform X1 [Tarenaya hassleriana]XP_010521051.1 PREDICTED: uncharacterized protein LOC104800042 isoform X2 [Tarenaya hassleriana]